MDDGLLAPDFRDILVELSRSKADFLLIGGWALAFHGHVRGTEDMDVLVRPNAENAKRVFAALAAFGAPVASHKVTPGLFEQERYGYRFGVKPHLVEVLTTIDGVNFDEAFKGHQTVSVDGYDVPVIGYEALLQNKRASGRPKDLADVSWLEANPPLESGS